MSACLQRFNQVPGNSAGVTRFAVICACAFLSACSSFPDWRAAVEEPVQAPIASDRFVLPPEGSDIVGTVQVTTARYEDTLPDIARRYNLGYEEIVAANPGIDPWMPGEGTRVILPTQFILPDGPRTGLVLNLAAMRLFYFPEAGTDAPRMVITHPAGIGRQGWQTPVGKSRITQKISHPAWTVPVSVRREHAAKGDPLPRIVPPGPDNPLGDFAMRLSMPQYLIHGTNQPWGVGLRVSHGCVRLYPEDIARLFPQVPVGTPVRIVNQPYVSGWRDGRLYLEAHKPLAEEAARWGDSLKPMKKVVAKQATGIPDAVNWEQAVKIAGETRGIPFPISPDSPDTSEVLASAQLVSDQPPNRGKD